MKTNGNDKALESYKIFPFVAWFLVFSFAFFVYQITQELSQVTSELKRQSSTLENLVQQQPEQIKDFEDIEKVEPANNSL